MLKKSTYTSLGGQGFCVYYEKCRKLGILYIPREFYEMAKI